ncbi:uncharacterized protein PADG_02694 [Paracoccidioides brasiliensis Pb18]|uniref:Uncharacterized protein n=2 Tax=Paracoccidioides brasiliensis TaxID=121759 RepID=C1G689_PARBD|nr:uncharacterized protein PADG_02694 [Paracoccidioides brasiliensis Pb18]EEH46596.1 hypothetical protein PADG_02694 [Paracoccidioides brasiliensis Pb18]ODH38290.1 hypothetical protein ACO22_02437 [Paracoccidioides brasiliensis]ODH51102.1 hypothetical protein GX48_02714 [Paracoccidioides brasiliensis]
MINCDPMRRSGSGLRTKAHNDDLISARSGNLTPGLGLLEPSNPVLNMVVLLEGRDVLDVPISFIKPGR